jgi:hypothetical protein
MVGPLGSTRRGRARCAFVLPEVTLLLGSSDANSAGAEPNYPQLASCDEPADGVSSDTPHLFARSLKLEMRLLGVICMQVLP